MDIRYSISPKESKGFDTTELRDNYLIEGIFVDDEIKLTYSHVDRIIIGGAMPIDKDLELSGGKELGTEYFLERREMGIINIGGKGILIADGVEYNLEHYDGLYIGKETKNVIFKSVDKGQPAKFYFNSVPAHMKHPTVKIEISKADPTSLGSLGQSNKRTIYKYVHPAVCKSCQLSMGLTILDEYNMWNTMPCHTHDRRMEVYFYFNLPQDGFVMHLMGEPKESRHIVMRNEEAVISPSWSIHSGVGSTNYTFIWGMCGENQEFTDMDHIDNKLLL